MTDDRRMTTDRFYGGVSDRLQNLRAMLAYIQEDHPTRKQLNDWIISNTSADSPDAVSHHLSFLDSVDLIELSDSVCELGPFGQRWLDEQDTEILYEALRSGVKGFETILRALQEEPLTDEELMDLLVNEFEEAEMTKPGPAIRHREWLQVLGYVERDDGINRLTEDGREVLDSNTGDPPAQSPDSNRLEAITESAPYYWVNQGQEEIEGEYLLAPAEERFQYDLPKLEVGDIVFSYHDGVVVGFHEVTKPARITETPVDNTSTDGEQDDTTEQYRVETDFTYFENPLAFPDVFPTLWEYRLDRYYPVNPGGINQQYLFNLSAEAGDYLLKEGKKTDDDSSEPSVDHPILTHIDTNSPTAYKFTAPPDYWRTVLEYRALPVEDTHTDRWQDASPGDIAILHSQQAPSDQNIDDQLSVVFGVGILGKKYEKEQPWLQEEHDNNDVFPYAIGFDRVFVTSDLDRLELETPTPVLSMESLTNELAALTSDGLSVEQVDELCSEATGIGFPTQGTFVTFRTPGDNKELDRPHAIIQALAPKLTELSPINYEKSFDGTLSPDEILDGLYFPNSIGKSIVEQIEAALRAGDHIILTGPPGTGKTEIANATAKYLVETYPYLYTGSQLTTATADWSTFDTVGGYMPMEDGEQDDDLSFTPGIVLNRLKDPQTGTQANEPITIDELNRADIDKGFGQLFTLLSGQSVQLPFTKNGQEVELLTTNQLDDLPDNHQYLVPDSWRIFATMNTYDKTSLYEMSYAFMRRFAFIRVPAPDLPDGDGDDAIAALQNLMSKYVNVWDGIDPTDEEQFAVGRVWQRTNNAVDERSIGPAIVRDMLGYVTQHTSAASDGLETQLTEAVISYIFPQLEGVPDRQQIVQHIATVDTINQSMFKAAARDMLQITLDEDT